MVTPITAISGISKRRAELLRDAQLGTMPELAAASPDDVRDVLAAAGQRVSRVTVERWLVEARAIEAEQWHRAASFVVSFESRGDDGEHQRERRTVVEQTEVDSGPAPTQQWRGWECSQVCEWMIEQVAPSGESPGHEPDAAAVRRAEAPDDAPPAAPSEPRQHHQIVGTLLVGKTGEGSSIVQDGQALAIGPVQDLDRVVVTVQPAEGSALVALRLRNTATGERIVIGPAELQPDGRAELVVSGVPAAAYDVAVVVWDEGATAAPGHLSMPLVVESPGRSV